MGNNVFVSYKYHDSNVQPLNNRPTIVRDYVDEIERLFKGTTQFHYRGEEDGNDMGDMNDDYVKSKLSDLMFYTTVTVVLMSPCMKESNVPEKDQWIPWEISYSLKENRRQSGSSHTNAVLVVVLPDTNGHYDYALEKRGCHTMIRTETFFEIIRNNMFNLNNPEISRCSCGAEIQHGDCSYIPIFTWDEFKSDYGGCINAALRTKENSDKYSIQKVINI